MPYKDADDRRRFDRDRRRRQRAEARAPDVGIDLPTRLRVVEDVEAILAEALRLARSDPEARRIDKAKALGYLAQIALRMVEAHQLQERVDALERVLKVRRIG